MQTITTTAAIDAVLAAAAAAVHQTFHVPDNVKVGSVVRQGDVFYVRVPIDHLRGDRQGNQVVTGETRGSRHTVDFPAICYVGKQQPQVRMGDGRLKRLTGAFLGAFVEVPERAIAKHPEHGHYSLAPGFWQVVQQMDVRTRQRMQD